MSLHSEIDVRRAPSLETVWDWFDTEKIPVEHRLFIGFT